VNTSVNDSTRRHLVRNEILARKTGSIGRSLRPHACRFGQGSQPSSGIGPLSNFVYAQRFTELIFKALQH
jgi:hypothetical protein